MVTKDTQLPSFSVPECITAEQSDAAEESLVKWIHVDKAAHDELRAACDQRLVM